MPQTISAAMPRGVPSVSKPTSRPELAPRLNCDRAHQRRGAAGMSGWRDSAPTVVLALLNPWQLSATTSGATISGRLCTPLNASATSVAVAGEGDRG